MNPITLEFPNQFETERLLIRAPRIGDGAILNRAVHDSWQELQVWMPWAEREQSLEESEANIRCDALNARSCALALRSGFSHEVTLTNYARRKETLYEHDVFRAHQGRKRMKFQVKSAAKINLSLDILQQRADGYHELASVVHTVGIWDEMEVEFNPNGAISFSCNRPELEGDGNLCVRAIQKWNAAIGGNWGAKIHLEKRIPTGAGLGGGSGNAAAILLALNRAAKTPLPPQNLSEIGAGLGADVPLFLSGGAVLMEGIGEKITPLSPLQGHVLIVKPEESFPTPAIYRAWDEAGLKSRNDTPKMLANWKNRDLNILASLTGNDFERAVARVSPLPAQLVALLLQSGALGAQMSGSGSACFGLFASETEARKAERKLSAELAKWVLLESSQIFVAPFCERGVEIAHP